MRSNGEYVHARKRSGMKFRCKALRYVASGDKKWWMTTVDSRFARQLLWAELTVRFVRSFCIDWAPFGKKSLSVIRNSGVVAVQGFSFYCGNGDAIGTSVSVRYIVDVRSSGVVVKRGSTVYKSSPRLRTCIQLSYRALHRNLGHMHAQTREYIPFVPS